MHTARPTCFRVQSAFKDRSEYGRTDFRPVKSFACTIKKQIYNFLCKSWNFYILVRKQSAIDIRKRRQVVIYIWVTVKRFSVKYSEKFNKFSPNFIYVKFFQIISKHFIPAENSCIFRIQTENQSHSKHIQTFKSVGTIRVLILLKYQIVQLPDQFTDFQRNFNFTFNAVIVCINKEL